MLTWHNGISTLCPGCEGNQAYIHWACGIQEMVICTHFCTGFRTLMMLKSALHLGLIMARISSLVDKETVEILDIWCRWSRSLKCHVTETLATGTHVLRVWWESVGPCGCQTSSSTEIFMEDSFLLGKIPKNMENLENNWLYFIRLQPQYFRCNILSNSRYIA